MNNDEQRILSNAYAEVLNTHAGRLVMSSIMEQFSVTVPVYAYGVENNLADISYRDGQRNCGIYVYNQIALASPEIASRLYADLLMKENIRINEAGRLRTVEGSENE